MSIHGIYRVRTICNDCSPNLLIFGITFNSNRNEPERANKYRKGIRNTSANSVNQIHGIGRRVPNDRKGRQVGWVERDRPRHGTAVHGRAELGRVG